MRKITVSFFIIISSVAVLVNPLSFEEDVRLTATEKNALDKFKLLVIPKIPKTSYLQNYINDDLYFIHWLRARDLRIRAADEMFVSHLKWRERESIDNICEDGYNWDQFDKENPAFYNDTVDKEGRPIGEHWLGEWNVRKSMIAGLSHTVIRSGQKLFETLLRRVYKARSEGKKVSQAVLILDLEGFSIFQHACPSCLPLYLSMALMLENHYPYLYDSVILINMPSSFNTILTLFRPILSGPNVKALKTFSDMKLGLNALDKKIEKNQRSVRLGGTIIRDFDRASD